MKVTLSGPARADLRAIYDFIRADSPPAAARVVTTILARLDQLGDLPSRGRPGRVEGTRELVVSATGHVAAYFVRDGVVVVLRIKHSLQDWPK